MDPFSITVSIFTILQLTVKVSEYLRDTKDASTGRGEFKTEISNLSKLLLDLLSRVDESSDEPWHTNVRALGGKDGLVYQYRVALEQLRDKISEGRGILKLANVLLWKFIRDDVDRIMSRIERLKSLVHIALEMDHFKLSAAIGSRVASIQNSNEIIRVGVDAIQNDHDRQKHGEIIDWLSSTDFPAQQNDFIARRQEETGTWFLSSHDFNEWVQRGSQTLFCPGIPGAGKTMMAAITIDHLQNTEQTSEVGVAFIYCNYKRQAEQTASVMLTAILKQLVQDRPSIAKTLSSLHEQHRRQGTKLSLKETFETMQSVLTHYSRAYVVIDALDECLHDNRQELLNKLRELQGKANLRLMVTSRFIPEIVDDFNGVPQLEVRADDADVRRFVSGQIIRLPRCIQRDKSLQELVQDKIIDAVDGMFLLARLHVDSLLDKDTKKKVKYALENLKKGSKALEKAYDGAIQRIESQLSGKSARAKEVLSWITCAQRPLTTEELCHALAVEPGHQELDEDNIPDVEDLVSVCAGLVTVDEESKIIRLVHYTTQDYLKGILEKWNPRAQLEISSTCLTYLCFDTFKSGHCDDWRDVRYKLLENVFLDYSARYWGQHIVTVQKEVFEEAMCLLQDDDLVQSALQVEGRELFFRGATGLHYAASLGLLHLSNELLSWPRQKSLISANSTDINGRTPLSWAGCYGHEAVVKLLLEQDVEADVKDNGGATPLLWAAENGHEAVVKLLLEQDVEADVKDNGGATPLLWAAENGHEAVVKLLLERDVEADVKDDGGKTPLLWAAYNGHEAVVKLLLERDVEADVKDDDGKTPLLWAVENGHEAVVKLLLKQDNVKADSKDKRGRTPLLWAAYNGHEAVVKLLLERDVETDVKDNYGETPLSWAAAHGKDTIVKLLLEQGDVDVNSRDTGNRTPLLYAALEGKTAVVKLLLERDDVEVNAADEDGRTAQWWAAHHDHKDALDLILSAQEALR